MKKLSYLLLIIGVIWGLYLLFVSFWPLPTNYQSCSVWARLPILKLMTKTKEIRCVMTFSGGKLYQRCLKQGGNAWFLKGDYCQLSFYNPDFIFPTNYQECLSFGGVGGVSKTDQGENCSVAINTVWVKDKNQVEIIKGLVNKCLEISADEKKGTKDGFCELKFNKKN